MMIDDFMEAYKKAYAHVRKQLMYENANKLWKDLKLDKHLWEEKYKMKLNELKLLSIKTQEKSLNNFTQPKLSFSNAKAAPKKDSSIQSTQESQVPTSNEDGKSNSGRFYKKCFKLTFVLALANRLIFYLEKWYGKI